MDTENRLKNFTLTVADDNLRSGIFYDMFHFPALEVLGKLLTAYEYYPWIFSLIGSILVGLSGILPLLIIPIEEGESLKSGAGAKRLKILLSFAVGGLLGDVFLHLLPEAWEHQVKTDKPKGRHPSLVSGMWVLTGMLIFVIVEKLFSTQQGHSDSQEEADDKTTSPAESNVQEKRSGPEENVPKKVVNNNTKCSGKVAKPREHYHISGYLNLMANSIDNFTHGLAIGGSFCISFKIGVLSTFAILIHEIPHEVGDFAILLKSGFSRWDAARAQICTATAGIIGSMIAVGFGSSDSIQTKTSWILPFTAGGFLHIALVTVLPELVKEKSGMESFKQIASLLLGIVVMALVIIFFE